MKNITILSLLAVSLLLTACIESENKNHRPFEPTVQTDEQRAALMKLEKKARANYEAKSSNTH